MIIIVLMGLLATESWGFPGTIAVGGLQTSSKSYITKFSMEMPLGRVVNKIRNLDVAAVLHASPSLRSVPLVSRLWKSKEEISGDQQYQTVQSVDEAAAQLLNGGEVISGTPATTKLARNYSPYRHPKEMRASFQLHGRSEDISEEVPYIDVGPAVEESWGDSGFFADLGSFDFSDAPFHKAIVLTENMKLLYRVI